MKPYSRFARTALAIACVAMSGCAVVSSTKLNRQDVAFGGTGIPYLLPKALLPVEVVAAGAHVRVDLLEPVYVGDATQSYALRYDASSFATDSLNITVDPTTSLLKTLSVETKDETGEVLKKAISTLRAESAAGTGETVLMQAVLDPGDDTSIADVEGRVRATLDSFVARQRQECEAAATTKLPGCGEILALPVSTKTQLSVKLMAPAPYAAGGAPSAPISTATAGGIDCGVGICFRGTLPYQVSLEAIGQTRSTLIHLPNHGPTMALPLSRHAFVKTKHTIGLRNGMLESYAIEKPSSALAIVSWPLDVYNAIVDTTAKIVQLKIDTSRSSVSLQEQLLEETKRRKEIEDELEKLRTPKAESAALIGMGGSRAILTLGVGRPPTTLPPGATT
ncbi:MAG: hypothetical protein KDB32_13225, partial [Planctomycetes bacterium]|nr:hypothetical protein [Planctomycetota bacterium]